MTTTIRQLPPSVINKIAAGEVIERPASVVKELLENAVDAGASRIDVTIEKGGADLVRVADNGSGIAADELRLAVASHATSKIIDADDLFAVHTLGFRGEALASIAEISHFTLRSRTAQADAGAELEVRGGSPGDVAPCGCPVGTTIEVRQLFFNTPVRRKFLRTTQTEMGHIIEAFTRIALAFPQVHFTLHHGGRTLHDLASTDSWRERIGTFFGREVEQSLIPIESRDGDVQLHGFVANPSLSRGNNRMQYLFLNGRHIKDRALQHALGEAYRGLLLTGRYPIAFLNLHVPVDTVDVNVHPTKLEVRFQDGGALYSQLLSSLRSKFLSTDLTATVSSSAPDDDAAAAAAVDTEHAAQHRQQLNAWAQGAVSQSVPAPPTARQGQLNLNSPAPFKPFPAIGPQRTVTPSDSPDREAQSAVPEQPPAAAPPAAAAPLSTRQRDTGIQVHNRYLVTENQDGVVIIDQHALHERVLYEQLREKVLSSELETQRLLVPEPVTLTAAEAASALEAQDTLRQLGIEIEPFGGDTILVSSYPAMLANLSPSEMLRQVLEKLMSGGVSIDSRDLLDELLHMISCKAAIKAGDQLSGDEVNALLAQRHLFQDTHHCPHGRPTALVFSNEELDKRFKRT